MPLAGRPGTRTCVRSELAHLLVVGFVAVVQSQQAARRRVLTGEGQSGRHLLHGQVPDAGGERATAGRAAAQLLPAGVAEKVTRLALQDWRQHEVQTNRTLEEGRELR